VVHAAHCRGRSADADSAGDSRRTFVKGHGVAIHSDLHLGPTLFGLLAGPLSRAEVELQEMRVGAAGEDVETAVDQRLGEGVRVAAHLRLVIAERLASMA